MQATPDWVEKMTAEKFRREFPAHEFDGPGFYLSDRDTMLVVPQDVPKAHVWHKNQPRDTVFEILVFNCAFADTVLSVVANAPVRVDIRT